MCECKCCRCCSFESLGCRLRTLKAAGALLILFGVFFALGGIAVGFIADVYVDLPDVFPQFTLYTVLVTTTGFSAVVTGMGAIYIARTMNDDDYSTRGLSILALLTIMCSLASVGVPTWLLYEEGYFLEIPAARNGTEMPTTLASTAFALTSVPTMAVSTVTASDQRENTTTSFMNMTSPVAAGTTTPFQVTINSTDSIMLSLNSTITLLWDTGNSTVYVTEATDSTVDSFNSDSSEMATATGTADGLTGTFGNLTTIVTDDPSPLYFDKWIVVIIPFGIICFFAFAFVLFALLIFCIGCCCAGRSEIVDDIGLEK